LEPMTAFRKVLEGTPFQLSEAGGALLVTQVMSAPPTILQMPEGPIPEVEIEASRAALDAIRAEILELENRFYAEYNKVNNKRRLDVECREEIVTGSHLRRRSCEPVSLSRADRAPPESDAPGWTQEYQKQMVDIVSKHPELIELLKEHNALTVR